LTRKAGVVFLIALCHHGKVPLGTVGGAIRGVVQRLPAAAKTVELQCRRSFGANGAGPFADMQRFEKIVRKGPQFYPCKPILCCAPLFAHIRSRVGPKKNASRHNHELIQ
jgi:hypothetical protein